MSKFAIFAAALFAFAAWHSPDAAAQDYGQEYMKTAPSDAKGAAAAPAKTTKGKTPATTKRCTPPGGGSPKPC